MGPGLDTEPRRTLVMVPEGVAHALASETERAAIPDRVQMGAESPFAGELYEQVSSNGALKIPAGATVVACGLRRAWPAVGFAVDPGDGGGTLTAQLAIQVRGFGFVPVVGTAQAFAARLAVPCALIGARAQLLIINTGGAATRVRGSIFGINLTNSKIGM